MIRYQLPSVASVLCVVLLAGCADMMPVEPQGGADNSEVLRPSARPGALDTDIQPVPTLARTVDEFDTTTDEQRKAASAGPDDAERELGVTVASLGSPSEPGFWLKTPLVTGPARGRVLYPGTGKSVSVDLIPLGGASTAGSQLSLAAMRLVDAPLTGLPEVRVFRTGG